MDCEHFFSMTFTCVSVVLSGVWVAGLIQETNEGVEPLFQENYLHRYPENFG